MSINAWAARPTRSQPAGALSDGNLTYLHPRTAEKAADWPWMHWHAEWWAANSAGLDWQPIDLYRPYLDEGLAISSPVLLRDATRWIYGSRVGIEWRRFTEGASWPIEDFQPTHCADVDLDAAIMLGRE